MAKDLNPTTLTPAATGPATEIYHPPLTPIPVPLWAQELQNPNIKQNIPEEEILKTWEPEQIKQFEKQIFVDYPGRHHIPEGTKIEYYSINAVESVKQIIKGVDTKVYSYDGLYPGYTYKARVHHPFVVRLNNRLGVNEPLSMHVHGGHQGASADGHPAHEEWLARPNGYFDYVFESGDPIDNVGNLPPGMETEDDRVTSATIWYHDHVEHYTDQHVYRGLAGFWLNFDDIETNLIRKNILPAWDFRPVQEEGAGEEFKEERFFRERSKYDIPLVFQDRQFKADGSLFYETDDVGHILKDDGTIGDVMVVNGSAYPYFKVERRKYRFRMLAGSGARYWKLGLNDNNSATTEKMLRLTQDRWFYDYPIETQSIDLTPAQGADVVVDFSDYEDGAVIYLENSQLQTKGARPEYKLMEQPERLLKFIVKGDKVEDQYDSKDLITKYTNGKQVTAHKDYKYIADTSAIRDVDGLGKFSYQWWYESNDGSKKAIEGATSDTLILTQDLIDKVKELNDESLVGRPISVAVSYVDGRGNGESLSSDSSVNAPPLDATSNTAPTGSVAIVEETFLGKEFYKLEDIYNAQEDKPKKHFRFERENGMWVANGVGYDGNRIDEFVKRNEVELWTLENKSGGWSHPFHMHLEAHQVKSINGKPPPKDLSFWADTTDVSPNTTVEIYVRFRTYTGPFSFHCHNTAHEDNMMMSQLYVYDPKVGKPLPDQIFSSPHTLQASHQTVTGHTHDSQPQGADDCPECLEHAATVTGHTHDSQPQGADDCPECLEHAADDRGPHSGLPWFQQVRHGVASHSTGGDGDHAHGAHGAAHCELEASADRRITYGSKQHDCIKGTSRRDKIRAGGGHDEITAGDGDDWMKGGRGADIMHGDGGSDWMHGGKGADLFCFEMEDIQDGDSDTIADFKGWKGDRIELLCADAIAKFGSAFALRFIDRAAYSGQKGEVRFADGYLQADIDGDRQSDLMVRLVGVKTFKAEWLLSDVQAL